MENSADILNELKELSPFIARLEKINVFTVPAGYFENLSADILLGISSERGGIINTPLNFVSADVPRGYFENLSDQIMDKIKAQNTADELKSLSPMLYSIQNENVFEVPAGYFYGLAGTVVSKIKPQQTKVVVMKKRSTTFIKYAVAAAFTGVMALGVFKFTNSNKNNIDAVVALGDKIARENSLMKNVPAEGYATETSAKQSGTTVRVKLSRDREAIEQEISVAGCDPSIVLVGEHLRRSKDRTTVVGWTMGSMAALQSLQRGEVHVAGMHLFDPVTGESNLPFLRRSLKGSDYEVVTFATWEEGFLVRAGNPLSIRAAADLVEPMVTLVNREEGSGARLLLDQQLRTSGIEPAHVRGYDRIASPHFEVARAIAERRAEVGIGIRSAAQYFGLDFVPLQVARYDLVVPKPYLTSHPTLTHLFETLVSRPFRDEIEALGGYDTTETGKLHALRVA